MKDKDIDDAFIIYRDSKDYVQRYANNHLGSYHQEKVIKNLLNDTDLIDNVEFKTIVKKGDLCITNIRHLSYYIKNTHQTKYLLSHIFINPYKFVYLSTRIIIPYKKAEQLTKIFKIKVHEYEKDNAWIHEYVLKNNSNNSFYVQEETIMKDYLTEFRKNMHIHILDKLCVKQEFNQLVYYTGLKFRDIERTIADVINEANTININYEPSSVNKFIDEYSLDKKMIINNEQRNCVHKMIQHNILLVSGYPGVGKSTIVDIYCNYADKYFNFQLSEKIYVIAPTGMAVKSIRTKLTCNPKVFETMTIHKLIYTNEKKDIKTLIIDESSMINTLLMHDIIKIIAKCKCNVIFLGDTNQLPPIGIGEPFKYMLSCKSLHNCHLVTINRQNDSQLKETIKNMIEDPDEVVIDKFDGISLVFEDTKDFSQKFLKDIIIKYKLDIYNSKFVSPSHKYESGVKDLNSQLQKIYNGDPYDEQNNLRQSSTIQRKFESKTFKENDLLLLTKNISNSENVNGDFFKLRSIAPDEEDEDGVRMVYEVKKVDDNLPAIHNVEALVNDEKEMFDNYALGYCCTIHKTQGSQYNNIVIVIDDRHKFQWSKPDGINLLYTAVSRAQTRCIILGNKKTFYKALHGRISSSYIHPLTNIVDLIP
tara:strand:+ start:460 stop:2400 length:1941 start_codon:yes stop_codon:yes gene_type:complete